MQALAHRRTGFSTPPHAFTLVELLVVISIIAALVALLLPAVTGAVRRGNQTRILVEMQQFDAALKDYKNSVGGYPPNTQTDGGGVSASFPIDDAAVLADFKRHLKKAFPSHREPAELIQALVGLGTGDQNDPVNPNLPGGMNAAEALVFWIGGFSDDPKYPISGVRGPSYSLNNLGGVDPNEADPIDNRSWRLDVNIENLGPRNDENFFDPTDGRYVVYNDPQNPGAQRRINFWYLKAPGSPAPYVYFDASRAPSALAKNDPPASTATVGFQGADSDVLNELLGVYAVKRRKADASAPKPYEFANDGLFQILHPGMDEAWGVFPRVNPNEPANPNSALWLVDPDDQELPVYFPEGAWVEDLRDTLTNFSDGTLEDAQP